MAENGKGGWSAWPPRPPPARGRRACRCHVSRCRGARTRRRCALPLRRRDHRNMSSTRTLAARASFSAASGGEAARAAGEESIESRAEATPASLAHSVARRWREIMKARKASRRRVAARARGRRLRPSRLWAWARPCRCTVGWPRRSARRRLTDVAALAAGFRQQADASR